MWPEYASDKVIDALDKLIGTVAKFTREVAEKSITGNDIAVAERHVSANLIEVLELADQARLEGRRGTANSAAAIECASTLIRIAYRFELIAHIRLARSEALRDQGADKHQADFKAAFYTGLEVQRIKLRRSDSSERAVRPSVALEELSPVKDYLAALESTRLSSETLVLLARELAFYRRLPDLLLSLDRSLSWLDVS